jgi:hypothetical protein
VLDLLDPASPFKTKLPEAVRIDLASADAEGRPTVLQPLLPAFERGNPAVKDALREMHWHGSRAGAAPGPLAALQRHPTAAGWGVFAVAAAGVVLQHAVRR